MFLLMAVLTIAVILRFPASGELHEAGADGSYYAALTRLVYEFGRAPWTASPLSYFGLFPYSEGVGTPFLVASFGGVAGLEEVPSALLVTSLVTLVGAVGVFLCVARTTRSALGAIIGSLAFVTAPILLLYSSSALISRYFEVCWVPFIMLAAIERRKWSLAQEVGFLGPVIILTAATHLSFILVVVLFIGILLLAMIEGAWRRIRQTLAAQQPIKTFSKYYYLAFLAGCGALVAVTSIAPISYGTEGAGLTSYEIGIFPDTMPLSSFGNLLVSAAGGAGVFAFALALGAPRFWTVGNRPFNLPVLAGLLLIFALIGFRLYSRPLVAVIVALGAGVGFVSISQLRWLGRNPRRKQAVVVLVVGLVVAGTASSMVIEGRWSAAEVYNVSPQAYSAFIYVRAETRGNMFCNHYPTDRFLTAYTGDLCSPDLPGSALEMTPFISASYSWADLALKPRNITGMLESPEGFNLYDVTNYNPYAHYFALANTPLYSSGVILTRYNISYVFEYRSYEGQYAIRWYGDKPIPSPFLASLGSGAYVTFENDAYNLWWV